MRISGASLALVVVVLLTLYPSPVTDAKEKRKLEIFTDRGSPRVVKLYTNERMTFRAREERQGAAGVFGASPLSPVKFRSEWWPRRKKIGTMILEGHQPERRRWGWAPVHRRDMDSITLEGKGAAGRYRLIAEKNGYEPAVVVYYVAHFRVIRMRHSLLPRLWDNPHYSAAFELQILDPFETRSRIRVRVECLDEEQRVIDSREDVVLIRKERWPAEFRSNRRIKISNDVIEGFRDRLARREEDGLPADFFRLKSMRIRKYGYIRFTFDQVSFTYPLPFGPRRSRPKSPGARGGGAAGRKGS